MICQKSDKVFSLSTGKSRLNQFRYRRSPSGLMGSTNASSIVTVEIFEEHNVILEMRVIVEFVNATVERSVSVFIFQENTTKSVADVFGNFFQILLDATSFRIFNRQGVTKKEMETL